MSNVCQNQEIFNKAFETAADTYKVEEINKMTKGKIGTIYTIMTLIYLIFIIWAVILAMRIEKKESRILHVTLALIAGPAYVFGYYLSI